MDLYNFLTERQKKEDEFARPVLFNLADENDRGQLNKLVDGKKIVKVADDYTEQRREFFAITHAQLIFSPDFASLFESWKAERDQQLPAWQQGRWVYFPWSQTLVHILEEEQYYQVRTARNHNLITPEEQRKFYEGVVGIAGLSVGNSVALSLALQGGARRMRLADFDVLSLSNTNRIRTSITELGVPKVIVAARQVYELNPYAELDIFSEGLTLENIDRFFCDAPRLEVVIDEMDSIALKYALREKARAYRIPLVMATDNGDNGIVDIERYDQDPIPKIFHGRFGETSYEALRKLDKRELGPLINNYLGLENITEGIKRSIPEIGQTLVSWPQLGGAALLNGCAVAYCVRRILNQQPLSNNRAFIFLDRLLGPQ